LPSCSVEVKVSDTNVVTVKGPKGELQEQISKLIKVEINDGVLTVTRDSDAKEARSAHGLSRTLINNMVVGVTEGFSKRLQLVGVGYKAEKKGNVLVMNLGYSHPIEMVDPEGIQTEVTTRLKSMSGASAKQLSEIMRRTSESGDSLNHTRARVSDTLAK